MNISIKDIIKSILLGICVSFIFTFSLGFIFNSTDGYIMVMGIAVISTVFFCTNLILKNIKNKEK